MDVTRGGRRELSFKLDVTRSSGGHLDSKGDPRESHSFAELVKAIWGTIPDPNRPEDIRPVLEIYGPGEYKAKKPAAAIASQAGGRSEERRGGKECVSTCRSRVSPYT